MKYNHFSKYILRSPLLPTSFFFNLTKDDKISIAKFKEACENSVVKEALYLASPNLYRSFEKWLKGTLKTPEAEEKMFYTILKYLSRMSSRCTPFGLFAGTSVGEIGNETSVIRSPISKTKRSTRLDMNYVVALSHNIVNNDKISPSLLFYPNSSIYTIGNQFRYVEYRYENSKRVHRIIGVPSNEYLEKTLNFTKYGSTLEELVNLLIDNGIDAESARLYINELVKNQFLVSELEPSVSGKEFITQLLDNLINNKHSNYVIDTLKLVQSDLTNLDIKMGNPVGRYNEIAEKLNALNTDFDMKYLFQTDMMIQTWENSLDKKWMFIAKRVMRFLNKITEKRENVLLKNFIEAFRNRYEEREVPLAQALDVELGIGFLQNVVTGDVSDLVDDIILPNRQTDEIRKINWTKIDRKLYSILQEAIINGNQILELKDDMFSEFEESWDDLPDTISIMAEIVNTGDNQQMIVSSCGGTSAANLLGRFCYGEKDILSHVNHIVEIEKKCNPDVIQAEIVHLPEARVGNILMRPSLRDYEIPYLAKSTIAHEKQLPLEDLMISLRNKQIYLRSKKYNKQVMPYLSNAHNYSYGALPIYQFLANLQAQGSRKSLSFRWGEYATECTFLPRVIYKGSILSVKTWNLKKPQIQKLKDSVSDKNKIQSFIDFYKLPKYVLLIEGDNELLINLQNTTSLKMFLSIIEKKSQCKIKEFLHLKGGIVNGTNGPYTNQFVFSFYNESKVNYDT